MLRRFRILILFITLGAALGLLAVALRTSRPTRATPVSGLEAELNLAGSAYEINRDAQDKLWVSDFATNQIWHINPASGAYTIYEGMEGSSDARADANGGVWWTDYDTHLSRLEPASGTLTTWSLPGAVHLWGTASGDSGAVWVTDAGTGQAYRFMPDTHQVCTYTVPGLGPSDYVLAGGGGVWLGDNLDARIVKLDPVSNTFTYWQLPSPPETSFLKGLALAEDGDLWFADANRAELGRLKPASNQVTTYTLPAGSSPAMITLGSGLVWYSDNFSPTFGVLHPVHAAGTTFAVAPRAVPVAPDCVPNIGSGTTIANVVTSTGTLTWSTKPYSRTLSSGGVAVYQLPADGYTAGITIAGGQLWVVDQGRQRLVRLSLTNDQMYTVFLPVLTRH